MVVYVFTFPVPDVDELLLKDEPAIVAQVVQGNEFKMASLSFALTVIVLLHAVLLPSSNAPFTLNTLMTNERLPSQRSLPFAPTVTLKVFSPVSPASHVIVPFPEAPILPPAAA